MALGHAIERLKFRVYILLRQVDRFAADSQFRVCSYHNVLWQFLALLFLDAIIVENFKG